MLPWFKLLNYTYCLYVSSELLLQTVRVRELEDLESSDLPLMSQTPTNKQWAVVVWEACCLWRSQKLTVHTSGSKFSRKSRLCTILAEGGMRLVLHSTTINTGSESLYRENKPQAAPNFKGCAASNRLVPNHPTSFFRIEFGKQVKGFLSVAVLATLAQERHRHVSV